MSADDLPYPARSLARHTGALMEFLRQPHAGLFHFDGTAEGLASARTDLHRIAEINDSMPIFQDLTAKVDDALTLIMPFDGHGEHLPHDAWTAYNAAEAALVALERRAGLKHTWHAAKSRTPNPNAATDSDAAVIEITAAH